MHRRILALLGIVALALVGVACDNRPTQRATDFNSPPYTRGIEVGHTYNYALMTHCGIRQARIDGTHWKASPTLIDANGSPPAEWDQPVSTGDLEIVSANKAIFTVGDLSATFVRDDSPGFPCA